MARMGTVVRRTRIGVATVAGKRYISFSTEQPILFSTEHLKVLSGLVLTARTELPYASPEETELARIDHAILDELRERGIRTVV